MLHADASAAARAIVRLDEELMSCATLCGHQSPLQITGCSREKLRIGLAAASSSRGALGAYLYVASNTVRDAWGLWRQNAVPVNQHRVCFSQRPAKHGLLQKAVKSPLDCACKQCFVD